MRGNCENGQMLYRLNLQLVLCSFQLQTSNCTSVAESTLHTVITSSKCSKMLCTFFLYFCRHLLKIEWSVFTPLHLFKYACINCKDFAVVVNLISIIAPSIYCMVVPMLFSSCTVFHLCMSAVQCA